MIIWLESLGCSRNQVDSEIMLGRLAEAGHIIGDDPSTAELIIVNTCGFISDAADEAVDTILEMAEYKTHGSCRHLVVTGCLPERFKKGDLASSLPEVDIFLGTGAVDFIVEVVEGCIKGTGRAHFFPDPCKRKFQAVPFKRKLTLDYSAYVKISEGCNRKCTYCIIPKLRGRQRSRLVDDIIFETKNFILQGVKEIIFTGENTTDYGMDFYRDPSGDEPCQTLYNRHEADLDLPSRHATKYEKSALVHEVFHINGHENNKIDLACLLNKLSIGLDTIADSTLLSSYDTNKKSNEIWFRLLYTHPSSLSHEIIRCISKLKEFCTYYDVPVQHASSEILKKMGRPYTKKDLYSLFKFIRKTDPDAVLRTTIITGFPGETDEDFQILLNFIKDIKFDNLGVFTYSDSEDLKSHNFENHVPEDLARQRQDIIMAEQAKISDKINKKHLGKVYRTLVEENPDDGIFLGRTSFQAPEVDGITFIDGSGLEIGTFVDVRITETFEYDLAGEIENS